MLFQPMTAAPLLGLAATLVWAMVRPGAIATIATIACAVWLVWALRRQAEEERRALAARLAQSEQRSQMHVSAAAASDAARSSAEAELRATAARQPGRSLGIRRRDRRNAVLAPLGRHARLRARRARQ
jgi:hypothetical protein